MELESTNKSLEEKSTISSESIARKQAISGYLLPKDHPFHIPPHVALAKLVSLSPTLTKVRYCSSSGERC